ncbi:hypothetical protein LINPERHAP1_LOCUS32653 [Linum perenne]
MMPGVPEWDEEHILQLFGSRDAMQILSIPLACYNLDDRLIWHFNKDGRYTVRSAYRVYMERVLNKSHLHVGGDWTSLWAFRAQPKIKHFAGRLGRGVLPTRTALRERRIGVPVACAFVRARRRHFGTFSLNVTQLGGAGNTWVSSSLSTQVPKGLPHLRTGCCRLLTRPDKVVQEVLVVLWSLWKERNARVWDNKRLRPVWILKPGLEELTDWLRAKERGNVVQ